MAFDLYIPIGDILLMCLTCAFNDLEGRFDTCSKMDIKYEKYCSANGFLSVIMNHTNEVVEKARLYIVNSRPTLELGIKEKESVIGSGLKVPENYMKKLGTEKKLINDVDKFLISNHNT